MVGAGQVRGISGIYLYATAYCRHLEVKPVKALIVMSNSFNDPDHAHAWKVGTELRSGRFHKQSEVLDYNIVEDML